VDDMSDQDKRHLWNGKEPSYYVTGHAPQSEPAQAEQPYTQYPYEAAISWAGFNVFGNVASINAVKTAIYEAGIVPELRERIKQAEQPRNEPVQQEPVAIVTVAAGVCTFTQVGELFHKDRPPLAVGTKLYTSPQAQPMSDEQQETMPMREKEELAQGYFAEDWAISKALDMLYDYEKRRGMK
jgi:hypothetical protein